MPKILSLLFILFIFTGFTQENSPKGKRPGKLVSISKKKGATSRSQYDSFSITISGSADLTQSNGNVFLGQGFSEKIRQSDCNPKDGAAYHFEKYRNFEKRSLGSTKLSHSFFLWRNDGTLGPGIEKGLVVQVTFMSVGSGADETTGESSGYYVFVDFFLNNDGKGSYLMKTDGKLSPVDKTKFLDTIGDDVEAYSFYPAVETTGSAGVDHLLANPEEKNGILTGSFAHLKSCPKLKGLIFSYRKPSDGKFVNLFFSESLQKYK